MRGEELGACVSEGHSPVRMFPAPLWVTRFNFTMPVAIFRYS